MAYELPLVRIYQQLETVSPTLASPDLPVCVIGRAYQVKTYASNKDTILAGNYNVLSGNTFNPPGIVAGGIMYAPFTKLYFGTMYVEITNGTFNSAVNSNLITDLSASFDTQNINIGDKIVINHGSLTSPLERTVLGISPTVLTVNKNFTTAMTGATYSVQKKLVDRLIPTSDYAISGNLVTVPAGLTHTYQTVTYPVMSGEMYLEYKALRTDLTSDVFEASSNDEVLANIGIIDPENPLGLGVNLALANTTTAVKYIAVNTPEDSDVGWSNVIDILENKEDVYFLALLTDKASIIGLFGNHCTQMSTADYHAWRVCCGGTELITTKTLIEQSSTGEIYDNGGTLYFRDNAQEFLVDGVSPADRIEITGPVAVTGSYTINTILSDNELEVVTGTPFPVTATGVTYTIERTLERTAQANEIAAVVSSFNNKRVIITWPDEIDVDGKTVNGYYLGCVIGGMVAGLPPHQGFTNLGIGGVEKIRHSNTYFNRSQLDTIAGAGTWIFIQDNPSSLPYVRHQITTDMQFVETRELNVVKNFDYLSYYFYGVLKPFIGVYNVTDRTKELIIESINLAAEKKQKQSLPKIGAPLKSWEIVSFGQSPSASDRVEGKVRLDLPRPLNGIDLYLAI